MSTKRINLNNVHVYAHHNTFDDSVGINVDYDNKRLITFNVNEHKDAENVYAAARFMAFAVAHQLEPDDVDVAVSAFVIFEHAYDQIPRKHTRTRALFADIKHAYCVHYAVRYFMSRSAEQTTH